MTKEELFRAVGEVREDQITEAENMSKQSRPWRRYGTMAACLALVLAGVFALGRLGDARRWAEVEENFQTAVEVQPESAPDAGGGAEEKTEDGAGLDGAEYGTEGGKRPASHYSVNVEIGELGEDIAEDREGGAGAASCLVWLSPEEIFARDTAIFRGTVRGLRYYAVECGGFETEYTAASVEVTDVVRGDVLPGDIRTVVYMGGPHMSTSVSGPLEKLADGSDAVFMPIAATAETGRREGDSWFCYADLGDFYLSEGLRFVFLDTGEGLEFERGVYEEISSAETLEEVTDYLRRMTGEAERTQPAAVPPEPQEDPGEIDPAALDPGYGAEGPNGGREADA